MLLLTICTSSGVAWGQRDSTTQRTMSTGQAHTDYDSVSSRLKTIGDEDQKYRVQLDETVATYGGDSPEMKQLLRAMSQSDSLNVRAVCAILTQYGWLGSSEIGEEANKALFMVVQHADQATQERYLPLMQAAVKANKLKPSSFALLQDRLAIRQGRKQIYGSQISWNMKTNRYYVFAIDDPDQVDQRRKSVGLVPIAVYIQDCCQLVWDVAAYKKDIFSLKSRAR